MRNEIGDNAAVGEAAGGSSEESFAVRGTVGAEDDGSAGSTDDISGVGEGVAELVDGVNVAFSLGR